MDVLTVQQLTPLEIALLVAATKWLEDFADDLEDYADSLD